MFLRHWWGVVIGHLTRWAGSCLVNSFPAYPTKDFKKFLQSQYKMYKHFFLYNVMLFRK